MGGERRGRRKQAKRNISTTILSEKRVNLVSGGGKEQFCQTWQSSHVTTGGLNQYSNGRCLMKILKLLEFRYLFKAQLKIISKNHL